MRGVRRNTQALILRRDSGGEIAAAGHGNPEAAGSRYILIERRPSLADRIVFANGAASKRTAGLIPNLLPEHTQEFYEEVC